MLLNIKLCAGADTVTQALREWPINCDGKDKSEDGTGYLRNTQGEVMTAEIVWRNPLPPTNDGASIERVTADDGGAVYAVSRSDARQNFELIMGGVA